MRKVGLVRGTEAVADWRRREALAESFALSRAAHQPTTVRRRSLARVLGLPLGLVLVVSGSILPGVNAGSLSLVSLVAAAPAPAGLGLSLEGNDPGQPFGVTPDQPVAIQIPVVDAAPSAAVDPAVAAQAAAVALADHVVVGPAGAAGPTGIPATVLEAYRRAEQSLASSAPSCHLPWWVLAGIGRIESGHASGGRVDAAGTTRGRILGPRLDGSLAGTSVIMDSDGGRYDGDPVYDRAVGPMQFLPGTWRSWGRDGNGDGVADPHNVYDATLAAGSYLCASGGDLSVGANLAKAILTYNHSMPYLQSVLSWGMAYRDGATPTSDGPGTVPATVTPRQPVTPAPVLGMPPEVVPSLTAAPPPTSTTTPPPVMPIIALTTPTTAPTTSTTPSRTTTTSSTPTTPSTTTTTSSTPTTPSTSTTPPTPTTSSTATTPPTTTTTRNTAPVACPVPTAVATRLVAPTAAPTTAARPTAAGPTAVPTTAARPTAPTAVPTITACPTR